MNKNRDLKNTVKLFAATVILALSVSVVWSKPKGNETKGRFYFKQTCKSCHAKGASGGEITPMSKTQVQWERYFTAGKHNKGTELLSKHLNDEQLHDALVYLVNHAVDSPQPETCGK